MFFSITHVKLERPLGKKNVNKVLQVYVKIHMHIIKLESYAQC